MITTTKTEITNVSISACRNLKMTFFFFCFTEMPPCVFRKKLFARNEDQMCESLPCAGKYVDSNKLVKSVRLIM